MNVIFWTSGVAVLLMLACAAMLRALMQTRRLNAKQRELLGRQQEQLRVIRKKLYRVGKELQTATQTVATTSKAHRELAKQHSAVQETTPACIRRHLALADTNLSKRIAATGNRRLQQELEEKREAIRTIMQLLISSRLEAELATAAQSFAVASKKEDLVRRRVNEMFPKVLAEPYRKEANHKR